ncbi:MAG: hypothetical protein ABIP75_12620 [Pyrinomonadaceae bacterium]
MTKTLKTLQDVGLYCRQRLSKFLLGRQANRIHLNFSTRFPPLSAFLWSVPA